MLIETKVKIEEIVIDDILKSKSIIEKYRPLELMSKKSEASFICHFNNQYLLVKSENPNCLPCLMRALTNVVKFIKQNNL